MIDQIATAGNTDPLSNYPSISEEAARLRIQKLILQIRLLTPKRQCGALPGLIEEREEANNSANVNTTKH